MASKIKAVQGIILLTLLASAGCAAVGERRAEKEPVFDASVLGCAVDEDRDGFGLGCPKGKDCDDLNPRVHTGCGSCDSPSEGCSCLLGAKPVDCFEQDLKEPNTLLCKQGKRYCVDGTWTACRSLNRFSVEVQREQTTDINSLTRALVPADAGTMSCSPCRKDCYPVTDLIDPENDGGLTPQNSENVVVTPTGDLTVKSQGNEVVFDGTETCDGGVQLSTGLADTDCDGLPDSIDDAPNDKPFGYTTSGSLFLQLDPGESESRDINLTFFVRTVDVYFLLDTSQNVDATISALQTAMQSGSYLNSAYDPTPADSFDCADTDQDGQPNNELKTQGIVGNLSCVARESGLGLGWVREIPFGSDTVNWVGIKYGDADEFLYEHLVDIDTDPTSLLSDLNSTITTNPNGTGPNGQILGLYLTSTGGETYVGWDRPAVPSRSTGILGRSYDGTCTSNSGKSCLPEAYDCPAGTWGYPCFRESAFPVVVMFTSEPMFNGPTKTTEPLWCTTDDAGTWQAVTNVPFEYWDSPAGPGIGQGEMYTGTSSTYEVLPNTNDFPGGAANVGVYNALTGKYEVTNTQWLTYTGNAAGFDSTPDTNAAILSCFTTTYTGQDVWFRFNVPTDQSLTVSAAGTRYANLLGIVQAGQGGGLPTCAAGGTCTVSVTKCVGGTNAGLDCTSAADCPGGSCGFASGGDTAAAPADLGTLSAGVNLVVTGDSSTAEGDFFRELAGFDCYSQANVSNPSEKATDVAPDVVMKFTPATNMTLYFETTEDVNGTDFKSSLTLYGSQPGAVTNKLVNPTVEDVDLGVLDSKAFRVLSQNLDADATAAAGQNVYDPLTTSSHSGDYDDALFENATPSCTSGTAGLLPDVRVNFTISDPAGRTVRIDTSGDSIGLDAVEAGSGTGNSWSHMLGLFQPVDGPNSRDVNATGVVCDDETAADANANCQITNSALSFVDTAGSSDDGWAQLKVDFNKYYDEDNWANYKWADVPWHWVKHAAGTNGKCLTEGTNYFAGGPDAVFRIDIPTTHPRGGTVSSTNPINLQFNTVGSEVTTTISIHKDKMSKVVDARTNPGNYDTYGSADDTSQTLGTILETSPTGNTDGFLWEIKGDTSASGVNANYYTSSTLTGCSTFPATAQRDQAFHFSTSNTSPAGKVLSFKVVSETAGFKPLVQLFRLVSGSLSSRSSSSTATTDNCFVSDATAGGGKRLGSTTDGTVSTYSFQNVNADKGEDFYFVVTNSDTNATVKSGKYRLFVWTNSDAGSQFSTSTCDSGSVSPDPASPLPNASRVSANFTTPGSYYVVVKSDAITDSNVSKTVYLNVLDNYNPLIACAECTNQDETGCQIDSQHQALFLEKTLPPGNYSIIVRDAVKNSSGDFKLLVRDMSYLPQPLQCYNNVFSGSGQNRPSEPFTYDVQAGEDYYVVMRGSNGTQDVGDFQVIIKDDGAGAEEACSDNTLTTGYGEITRNFAAGDYYAVLKGAVAGDEGWYQLSLGNPLAAGTNQSADYVPVTWSDTVEPELVDSGIKVIGLNTGSNTVTTEQLKAIAHSTGALDEFAAPLALTVSPDATSMGQAVVQTVQRLALALRSNVTVDLDETPDNATPNFYFQVEAITQTGVSNGCNGVLDRTGPTGVPDGVPDTHVDCEPGAAPQFTITFGNPINAPVPCNGVNAMGVCQPYEMTLKLLASYNGHDYVIERIPVFLLPQDIVPEPPTITYEVSGSYWQDFGSPNCLATESPDWSMLGWDGTMPDDTTMLFEACMSETADFSSCTYQEVADVAASGGCLTDADCTPGSYCVDDLCLTVTGPENVCSSDADCGGDVTGTSPQCIGQRCYYPPYTAAADPFAYRVDMGPALKAGLNGKPYMRMKITMFANSALNDAPTVSQWQAQYSCVSGE